MTAEPTVAECINYLSESHLDRLPLFSATAGHLRRLSTLTAENERLRVALKEAEDFISAEHENLTSGDADSDDVRDVLKTIRAALSGDPK